MGVSAGPDIVEDGLIMHLDAGNMRSYPGTGTIWTDLSGQGNNASTIGDPVFTTASLGSFALTSDYFSCSHNSSLNFTNNLTISIVCSVNSIVDYASAISKTTSWLWNDGFGIYRYTDNRLYFWVNQWNAAQTVSILKSTFNLTHFIATYDGQALRLYENGVLLVTGVSFTSNIVNSTQALNIGRAPDNYYWPGNIAQVSIYNRALTQQEVSQNFNAIRGRYGI